ncbi:HAD family phosphatase [Paraflavisolibacter sp. H34]|uniref:HAD family hydrolase n=1 Tax=Huijunlia imazamoxiresistens TaxID=3127457 RepID=UPI00301AE00F
MQNSLATTAPLRSIAALEETPTAAFTAAIFDMDGTLIHSTQADYEAWRKLFADYGIDLTFERYFPLLGKKSADVVSSLLHLEGAEADAAMQQKMAYFKEFALETGIQTIPFVEAWLESLQQQGLRLALATSSRRPKTELVLEQTGLGRFFEVIVTGNEVEHGKPAPDIFLKAAHRLQVPAADCIVFEDAASGVQAAKSAGMTCVAITTTHAAADLGQADTIIDSYEAMDFRALCAAVSRSAS